MVYAYGSVAHDWIMPNSFMLYELPNIITRIEYFTLLGGGNLA